MHGAASCAASAAPPSGEAAKVPVTAVVLTFNEERNLPACLESLRAWVDQMVVVDSGSTDGTVRIAQGYGAHVLSHPFRTHSAQWRWAMEHLPEGACEWILGLDADQRVTPELAAEIRDTVDPARGAADGTAGFYIKRRQIFRGRWIRHGGYYPKYLLKLFRRDQVLFDENDLVDHHFYVRGRTAYLSCDLIEENHKEDDIGFWIQKHCRYAMLMAQEEQRRKTCRGRPDTALWTGVCGSPDQRSLQMKRLWARLPLYLRPWMYFFYRYVLRLGFLDGKQGLVFHFLHACWFRLMVDVYLDELRGNEVMPRSRTSAKSGHSNVGNQ